VRNQIGWGFIGLSTITQEFMRQAVENDERSRVVALASKALDRAEAYCRTHGIPSVYATPDALLSDLAVDVVYISTVNNLHHPQILAAAAAGRHVLCDKPLATSAADAASAVAACEKAGVILGTNHHLREATALREMRRLIQERSIGLPLAARVFHAELLPGHLHGWRLKSKAAGGGVVLDLTVHDADLLRYLLDEEVTEVSGVVTNQGFGAAGIEDGFMGVMRLGSGMLASVHDAYTVPHAGTGVEIHGTQGSLIGREVLTQRPAGNLFLRQADRVTAVRLGTREDPYSRVVRRFNDAVLGNGTPTASGLDGAIAVLVALAALESAGSGERVRLARP
jgi:1,5-anhydro-D-fructose reductase (1,5-anhydro-D-mannitol-forming)